MILLVVAAIYSSSRGFSEELIAAGDTRHTVDADHLTQALTRARTLWGDLSLDANLKIGTAGCRYAEVSSTTVVLFRPM